jgi:hypothetical protein
MLSFFKSRDPKFMSLCYLESVKPCRRVESGILRLSDFGLARKGLLLLYLRFQLSGSNSVGRMPAS